MKMSMCTVLALLLFYFPIFVLHLLTSQTEKKTAHLRDYEFSNRKNALLPNLVKGSSIVMRHLL